MESNGLKDNLNHRETDDQLLRDGFYSNAMS